MLLILDRNIDLVPMISHGWTYQSLVHDCLKMRLNRVTVVNVRRSYLTEYSCEAGETPEGGL